MGTTGLIYVAIVAAWAAYLVPMWLRRSDEAPRASGSPSPERRVLARQTDDQDRARYVVRPSGFTGTTTAGSPGYSVEGSPPSPRRSAASNRARRVAAMRRRRVLSMLTLSLLSLTALASFAIVPWWSLGVPGGLIVLFVFVARSQVRKMQRRDARDHAEYVERARARAEHHEAGPSTSAASVSVPVLDAEETIEVRLPEPEAPSTEGLWDPVPVTLPTYVHKEKAPDRTVRTVNLSGPEVFSSARVTPEPEHAVYHPPVADPVPAVEDETPEIPRAVND
ncbi:divisome protein SepX/GlpR [Kribbella deserti]|uniref:MFS transporter n=1 Tax=Kribbella deserti TaxID=1926257 RepID=A0ABV6QT92_9ACTN